MKNDYSADIVNQSGTLDHFWWDDFVTITALEHDKSIDVSYKLMDRQMKLALERPHESKPKNYDEFDDR